MALLSCFKSTVLLWVMLISACGNPTKKQVAPADSVTTELKAKPLNDIVVGANRTEKYLPLLQGKKIGVVANQTSVIFKNTKDENGSMKDEVRRTKVESVDNDIRATSPETLNLSYTHLVDSLHALGIEIKKVFAPEHGFRGEADAGEHVVDGIDSKTGLPLISLYGKNRKPTAAQVNDLDVVIFDIQDVGVRFYTYIATLQLVMEACAENGVPIIVLDRPNPNGHYVDGPTMEAAHRGFLGMTDIPLVYGMTIGEYAEMINGEGWLENGKKADLKVIPLENWTHNSSYSLPIRPSPNLPNDTAINLYPSLGLFEGTNINAGRGTEFQFQRFGAPFLEDSHYDFSYTPAANFGSKTPKHKEALCYGKDLSKTPKMSEMSLQWLIDAYKNAKDKSLVFNKSGFTKHAGTDKLQQQIEAGLSEAAIKATWQPDLEKFKKLRAKYLLYE